MAIETPIERAAIAVRLLIDSHCPNCEQQLAGDPEEIARAVLQAIREPSEGMVDYAYGRNADAAELAEGWRDMIDAALAE